MSGPLYAQLIVYEFGHKQISHSLYYDVSQQSDSLREAINYLGQQYVYCLPKNYWIQRLKCIKNKTLPVNYKTASTIELYETIVYNYDAIQFTLKINRLVCES